MQNPLCVPEHSAPPRLRCPLVCLPSSAATDTLSDSDDEEALTDKS